VLHRQGGESAARALLMEQIACGEQRKVGEAKSGRRRNGGGWVSVGKHWRGVVARAGWDFLHAMGADEAVEVVRRAWPDERRAIVQPQAVVGGYRVDSNDSTVGHEKRRIAQDDPAEQVIEWILVVPQVWHVSVPLGARQERGALGDVITDDRGWISCTFLQC